MNENLWYLMLQSARLRKSSANAQYLFDLLAYSIDHPVSLLCEPDATSMRPWAQWEGVVSPLSAIAATRLLTKKSGWKHDCGSIAVCVLLPDLIF